GAPQRRARRAHRGRVVTAPRVVVLGDVMCDVVARRARPLAVGSDTAAPVVMRPGGSGASVAAWLAYAGVPVALIGRAGRDAAAEIAPRGVAGGDGRGARDPGRPTGTVGGPRPPGGGGEVPPDSRRHRRAPPGGPA